MSKCPDFITHYHYPDKKPFQNIMELGEEERLSIVRDLNERFMRAETQRSFPDWYFIQRSNAEENMRKVLREKGFTPERNTPFYSVLGRSLRLERIYNHNFGCVVLKIPPDCPDIFFSIGDSLWTFAEPVGPQRHWNKQWYHGTLFTYNEVKEVLTELNVDLDKPTTIEETGVGFVEALIWSDKGLHNIIKFNSH